MFTFWEEVAWIYYFGKVIGLLWLGNIREDLRHTNQDILDLYTLFCHTFPEGCGSLYHGQFIL